MTPILSRDNDLQAVTEEVLSSSATQQSFETWLPELGEHLRLVQAADETTFRSLEFQQRLWNSKAVSDTGMGNVDVTAVLTDNEVLDLLWNLKNTPLPESRADRMAYLAQAFDACVKLVTPNVSRIPRLKLYRVFAALFPTEFTTIAHQDKVYKLAKAMGDIKGYAHVVELHRSILDRLETALGRVAPPPEQDGIVRMALPWLLFARINQQAGEEATTEVAPRAGIERLIPLPAARRRKGLMSIGGGLETLASMLEFAREGCQREDFLDHIRSINPGLTEASRRTTINALIGDWGALRASGTELQLTDRGEAFLLSGRAEAFSDWLLTRTLGFDNVLAHLNTAPCSFSGLTSFLKIVNPGWTTNFMPSSIVGWMKTLGLIEADAQKVFSLTSEGKEWAAQIHWTPGVLSAPPVSSAEKDIAAAVEQSHSQIARQPVKEIIEKLPAGIAFPPNLIARLDANIWQHYRRHFAVLTGLSGAGKTLLARAYALGMWGSAENPEQGLYTLPVQPGWHDPSSLLGYINPLNGTSYVSTGFLQFLLRASGDPSRPYTVVLDEMNLSHPEQYLAPLLSAMETGDDIELHAFEEEIDGVPPSIPYPANLVIIGTVNMDETTHGLSDKILDRASVIEFWKIKLEDYPGWSESGLAEPELGIVKNLLTGLMKELEPVRLHFGWRVVGDILGYLSAARAGGVLDFISALDHAVYSKVLPKIRGEDTPRLRDALAGLCSLLDNKNLPLPESHAKATQLADDLKHTGTTRFWR